MTERVAKLQNLSERLRVRCIAALNDLAKEMSVIESDFGYSVELRHSGALRLLSVAREEAMRLGITLHCDSRLQFMHDRFVAFCRIRAIDEDEQVILTAQRIGEAMPTRYIRKTGEVVPSETAARTAETRALKRAIGILVPALEEKLAYLSELVTGWARSKNTSDTKQLEAWLVAWMQKVGFAKNGAYKAAEVKE